MVRGNGIPTSKICPFHLLSPIRMVLKLKQIVDFNLNSRAAFFGGFKSGFFRVKLAPAKQSSDPLWSIEAIILLHQKITLYTHHLVKSHSPHKMKFGKVKRGKISPGHYANCQFEQLYIRHGERAVLRTSVLPRVCDAGT
jgi:hypothetical protein